MLATQRAAREAIAGNFPCQDGTKRKLADFSAGAGHVNQRAPATRSDVPPAKLPLITETFLAATVPSV